MNIHEAGEGPVNEPRSRIDRHPLGFVKVNLLSVFGRRARLHVWPRGSRGNDAPHSHRWGFVSLPLWGRFVECRFSDSSMGDWRRRLTTYPARSTGQRRYVNAGSSPLGLVRRKVRWPMLPYLCRAGQIHSYVPAGPGIHASLVFLGRARSTGSYVWSRLPIDEASDAPALEEEPTTDG